MPDFTDLHKALLYLLHQLRTLPPTPPVLRVIIIRHGEKPAEGDNLSCAGLNRALALPAVLDRLLPTPPDFIYVPIIGTDSKSTSTARMFQTVTPYAVQHNLAVNSDFDVDNATGVADAVRHHRGTVLLVWEHDNIPRIAKKLGVKGPLAWPDDDFDSIWLIDFSGGGAKGKAKHPALTKGQEHIRPSATCPGQ